MNALVSYASDSESEEDEVHSTTAIPPKATSTTSPSTPTAATTGNQAASGQEDNDKPTTTEVQDVVDSSSSNIGHQDRHVNQGDNEEEDDFVSAALKDLQSFAASVDPSTSIQEQDDTPLATAAAPLVSTTSDPTITSTQPPQETSVPDSTDMDIDQDNDQGVLAEPPTSQPTITPIELTSEQQIIFDTFLQEIDAIPLTSADQTYPPGFIPHPLINDDPSHHASTSKTILTDPAQLDEQWIQAQTPQTIYSRIHQLSTLPEKSASGFDPKEVENRLIEFAIRLLDWEQGGLKPVYFLGEERAKTVLQQKELAEQRSQRRKEESESRHEGGGSSDEDEDEDEEGEGGSEDETRESERSGSFLPRYAGVVGEMVEFMHAVEKIAPPEHWDLIWSPKDLAYGFHHTATGTYSDEYPSTEVRNRLDPPSSSPTTVTSSTII
ncbi:hypothetical protein BGX23_011985 [Mortierella sp. AD031]|nr:hypothetical protein BGX23_011985 [Mortierella sp. AD031]